MYSKKTLTEKVHRIRDLERQISDMETELENLKYDIKSDMEKREVDVLTGDDWKASWIEYMSQRFDQTQFKKDHPDLYESYKVDRVSRRFSIK